MTHALDRWIALSGVRALEVQKDAVRRSRRLDTQIIALIRTQSLRNIALNKAHSLDTQRYCNMWD